MDNQDDELVNDDSDKEIDHEMDKPYDEEEKMEEPQYGNFKNTEEEIKEEDITDEDKVKEVVDNEKDVADLSDIEEKPIDNQVDPPSNTAEAIKPELKDAEVDGTNLIKKTKPTRKKKLLIVGACAAAFVLAWAAMASTIDNKDGKIIIKPSSETASDFAKYKELPINITPKVPEYKIAEDLKNVTNISDFRFSDDQQKLLVKNSFVVSPGFASEFFGSYESNRNNYVPNFVTTDSILHNYHLMFDYLLRQVEEQKLASQLKDFSSNMLAESQSQYDSLKGTTWENAAKRNVGFFAVGGKLLDSSVKVPAIVTKEVNQELDLIDKHSTIDTSPLMNLGSSAAVAEANKEDYTQYIPRGHYDKNDQLKAYFKSMMWYGRLTFRFKSEDEFKSAILITQAIGKGTNYNNWKNIYEPVNFFVGKSDDIDYELFKGTFSDVYGANTATVALASDDTKLKSFMDKAKSMDPPQINSMPIFDATINPDREKEIKGFRVMGQKFTIDSAIFQRLIDRDVPDRMLPKGLDIPAALGSQEALSILTEMGETKYDKYSANMEKTKTHIAEQPTSTWTQNLYWGWLHQLRPLLEVRSTGYPTFMQNDAWVRKDLNTFLGSWAELKHDTVLYAKQTYAEMGSVAPPKKDDRGYVEPNVEVYARLASLLKMTSEGLSSRNMLPDSMKDNLSKMETLVTSLKTISEKELRNETLTDDEYELIRSYGGQLEHFWLEVNKDEPEFKELGQFDYLYQNPSAIISDVATDPDNGLVLEEGTGYVSKIYVIIPIDGKLRVASGGAYSYYEFTQPMGSRLTDKQWRTMLSDKKKPELPTWTNSFVAK